MGYLNEESKTKEAFTPDGYYLTGDIGKFDKDGFLTITGRKKELIVTSSGKNIAPIPIEDRIKHELGEVLSYVVVVGEGRHFLTCLMTLRVEQDLATMLPTQKLDPTTIKWCEKLGATGVTTVEEFINGPEASKLRAAIQEGVDRANLYAESNPFIVHKWTILPKEFSMLSGEVGPTLKLKRNVVNDIYASTISQMYN